MYLDLKLKRIGGSLFGRIPAGVARELGWKAQDTVRVKAEPVCAADAWRMLKGVAPGIRPFVRDGKDWDRKLG